MQKHPWNTNGQSTASGGPHQNCVLAAQGRIQEISKAKQVSKKNKQQQNANWLALGSAEWDFLSEMPT